MNKYSKRLLTVFFILVFGSCTDSDDDFHDLKYEPQSVLVKTKGTVLTTDLFDFINGFDFEVKSVDYADYVSKQSGDRLDEILEDLNTRTYVNDGVWKATGYLHAQTGKMNIFTRLFDIRNRENQKDWLDLMEKHQLSENFIFDHSGFMIFFKVPVGEEKRWARHFRNLNFVEWAELNYYAPIVTHDR
jgi:hypothetical protein